MVSNLTCVSLSLNFLYNSQLQIFIKYLIILYFALRTSLKLRIAFDASAKYKDTMSLNVLCKGPCLNADLYSLFLKFRVHPIVLTANIEKAYLQININEEHRDYLRFSWYRNLKEEIIIRYRFTRVIFGVTSSQFLLNGTVQTHAKKI